jgi:hypothetical protein
MKKYKKTWNYLILALVISLTIIVINNINNHLIPLIIQDINSGVIGAILTTIITMVLLSNQSENQELSTKNSVVYEEKLKVFNEFISVLGKALADGQLTSNEIQNIIFSFSCLRIHISERSSNEIEKAVKSIDSTLFYVDENGVPDIDKYVNLYTIITNSLREELYPDQEKKILNNYDFSNFRNISYIPRVKILPIVKFEEIIAHLKNHQIRNNKIIHFSKDKPTKTFYLTITEIETFEIAYRFIEKLIAETHKTIQIKYFINKYVIENTDYLTIPWIQFWYKNKHIATFGMSDKKGIHFSKLIPEYTLIFSLIPGEDITIYNEISKRQIDEIIEDIDISVNSN